MSSRRVAGAVLTLLALAAGACHDARGDAVVLWHAYSGSELDALEIVTADAEDETGVEILLVSVPYEAFADKLTNAIPNGNGPDLFIFAHDRIGAWVAGGLVEPIEYYVDEELADRFSYDAIAAMAYEGSLYGLPLAVKSVALFYRKDLVSTPIDALLAMTPVPYEGALSGLPRGAKSAAKARIDALLPPPIRETDDFFDLAEDLRARGHDGYALVYENTNLYGHAAWLHGYGGSLFDESGEVGVATPEGVAALEFARRLDREGVVPSEIDGRMVATLFNEGVAATAISGPWFLGDIDESVPWGVTTLPTVSATGLEARPFLGAEGVLMSARARDKEVAFRVMNVLTGDDSAAVRAREARQVVPNPGSYRAAGLEHDPAMTAFRRQLDRSVVMSASPAMRSIWTPYQTALLKVIDQDADPADALRSTAREIAGFGGGEK